MKNIDYCRMTILGVPDDDNWDELESCEVTVF